MENKGSRSCTAVPSHNYYNKKTGSVKEPAFFHKRAWTGEGSRLIMKMIQTNLSGMV